MRLLLIVLLLSGCGASANPEAILKLDKLCAANDGVDHYYFLEEKDKHASVYCKNGAMFLAVEVK